MVSRGIFINYIICYSAVHTFFKYHFVVINNDISKADQYIESLKRDNKRYNELLEIKNLELVKLDEELDK